MGNADTASTMQLCWVCLWVLFTQHWLDVHMVLLGDAGNGYMMSDSESLQGNSPVSVRLSRPLSPLEDVSVLSFRSGAMTARSVRSTCTGVHEKLPLLPWYKRDVFAGEQYDQATQQGHGTTYQMVAELRFQYDLSSEMCASSRHL